MTVEIESLEDLENIEENTSDRYEIVSDLDGSNIEDGSFSAISEFEGVLEGNGHKISNLFIECSHSSYAGIIKENNGIVRNLEVDRVTVTGFSSLGIISGSTSEGEISNVTVKNSEIVGAGSYYAPNSAGIVSGEIYRTTLKDCEVRECLVKNGTFMGGLVGDSNYSTINNCRVYDSDVKKGVLSGGLIGRLGKDSNEISNCQTQGIELSALKSAGAFAGYHSDGSRCGFPEVLDGCRIEYQEEQNKVSQIINNEEN